MKRAQKMVLSVSLSAADERFFIHLWRHFNLKLISPPLGKAATEKKFEQTAPRRK
jgi:hypothetical protein